MLYRIVERRSTGGTYGAWQPVSDGLLVSLNPTENEIEFRDGTEAQKDDSQPCSCQIRGDQHQHRMP